MGETEPGLATAIRRWVRAEWEFRYGPRAYTRQTEDWYIAAERALRRLVTGRGGLPAAMAELDREREIHD